MFHTFIFIGGQAFRNSPDKDITKKDIQNLAIFQGTK